MKQESELRMFQALGRIEGKVDGLVTAQGLMNTRQDTADKRISQLAEQRGSGKVKTYGVIVAALTLATAATVGLVQVLG